jgi:carboxymethylenebutenolidase
MTPEDMKALWASHCKYRYNFAGTTPADAGISSVSLTVGGDQIAEEVILSFKHDREMPWLLPWVAPTGRRVESAQLAVAVRDGKIAHEHIWWDQASVLAQVGLLDPPHVPAFGVDTAARPRDLPPS